MKRILLYLTAAAIAAVFAVSCSPTEKEFNEQFLSGGDWRMGDDYMRFNAGHTGVEWNTVAGTTPADGRQFTWSLNGEEFIITYCFDPAVGDCDVPKLYTMVDLTQTRLVYKDDYTTRTFTR